MPALIGTQRALLGTGGAATSSYQQILDLATADGWTAVYDPTNPDTRTLRVDGADSYFESIADGLGNLPDLTQATEAKQMLLSAGEFGELDAAMSDAAASTFMNTAAFTAIAQPVFRIIVVRAAAAPAGSQYFAEGVASGNRLMHYRSSGNVWGVLAGTLLHNGAADTDAHVHGCLYNGASSDIYLDGAISTSGAVGAHSVTGLTIGSNVSGAGNWTGPLGAMLFYEGDPGAAKIAAMFDLLHSLSGIAQA